MDNSNLRQQPPPVVVRSDVYNPKPSDSRQSIQGQKRIEYIPYEKTIIEYEPITKIEYVPRERKVIEYYPVEYQTEYIPQVYQQKVIEYVPVEKIQQRVQYVPVQRQIFYPPEDHPEFSMSPDQENISRGMPIVSSDVRVIPPAQSSRIHPSGHYNNMSFQNSGLRAQPPQDNSLYTKEPLPSSKRRYT